jgi:hypothetical protein
MPQGEITEKGLSAQDVRIILGVLWYKAADTNAGEPEWRVSNTLAQKESQRAETRAFTPLLNFD